MARNEGLRQPDTTGLVSHARVSLYDRLRSRLNPLVRFIHSLLSHADRFLPPGCEEDPDLFRRARLVIRFGFLGFLSGILYATFYAFIGHYWGVGIIVVCSIGFVISPWVLRRTRSLHFAGNLLTGIMAAGFTALCFIENGLGGHAIAWLVSIPLCALLLVGRRAAWGWTAICFAVACVLIAVAILGIHLPETYDPRWEPYVSAAGYLGLILFMFMLGIIFETGREQAFFKMQDALDRLEASNEELIGLNAEKSEFLGIAAHDLKNPLTTIINNAELLALTGDAKDIPVVCEGIISASSRMRGLILDLLDANAIEEGRYTSRIERCDVADLVAESVVSNRTNASQKRIRLTVDSSPIEAYARADRGAAYQILDNLLSNAVKFSAPDTEVRISVIHEKERVGIAVIDQGPGLSVQDQKKLFRKYTKLSAQPTGGENSTGLGLSIVKRLAEAMSGTVECRSILGHGSAFTLWLPTWS